MDGRIAFLLVQIRLGKITLDNIPEPLRTAVEAAITEQTT